VDIKVFEKIDIKVNVGKEVLWIGSDRHNFILGDRKKDKKGNLVWGVRSSFYGDLESLFRALYKLKIKATSVKTLEQLLAAMKKAEDEVRGLYADINFEKEK